MGFLWLGVIGLAAAGLLAALRVPRGLWTIIGAALMLGATGYVLQGRPLLSGHPVKANSTPVEVDPGIVELRDDMFSRYTADYGYLVAADALTRAGDTDSAALWLLAGIRKLPDSSYLWTGLGTALTNHDGGLVSPASLFAFQHAMRLAPKHPGPPFFLGLAYVRAGQFADALPWWRRALALTPPGASYRQDISVRLALLERFSADAPPAQQ